MTATPASLFVRSGVFSCSWLQLASTFCDEWIRQYNYLRKLNISFRNFYLLLLLSQANEAKRQDLFQHIQNDESTNYDAQTLDSATADQAEEQEKGNFPDMDSEADKDEDDDYEMQSAFLEDKDEFPVSSLCLLSSSGILLYHSQ